MIILRAGVDGYTIPAISTATSRADTDKEICHVQKDPVVTRSNHRCDYHLLYCMAG
ncbi:hypothetical protein D1AOALGA4SA_5761 [Olavius algarvensis Delta 1 endosymbiont]|nr:hypothetical protein D1AOALGA4SA_5761 [Olavius algarvensis Delta 1 endosymbiont]